MPREPDDHALSDPAPDAALRLEPRAAFLRELVEQSGAIALAHFQSSNLEVVAKADRSPVTVADREIERVVRAAIRARFPDDALLGEEHGDEPGQSGWRWIIDPIDGTVSFAAGVPIFGTLIAVESRGEVVAGVCDMPALRERLIAAKGAGAWWERVGPDGRPLRTRARVRPCADLATALVCTTGLEYYERAGATEELVRLGRAAGRVRGWSDCYGGMLVATGRADGWIDPVMNPWDSGPFPVILAEAGGVFTDWNGGSGAHGGSAIAGGAGVHRELLALVAPRG